MKSKDYQQILQHNIGPSVRKLGLPQRSWVFQQDNDPKHTSKSTRKWFERKHWRLLRWPAMSSDLNPIKHLWRDLKMAVWRRHPSNIRDLEQFAREEWSKIPTEHCKKLIDGYRKRRINEKSVWCSGWLPCSPLRIAATAGHADCVAVLIDFGAQLELVDVKGQTPLFVATENEHLDCVEVLLKAGADPNGKLSAEMERKMYNLSKQLDVEEVTNMLLDDRDLTLNEDLGEESEIDSHDEVEECVLDSETEQDGDSGEDEEVGSYYIGKYKNTKWNKKPFQKKRREPLNIITHLPAVIGTARNAKTAVECWNSIFTDDILDSIVTYTNQYIDIIKDKYICNRTIKPTDEIELRAFFGLLYLAGAYRANRQSLEELWGKDGDGVEKFSLVMSINRFKILIRCLRFDDRTTRTERKTHDRLAPIRDIFQRFVVNCKQSYYPGENLTIDEMLPGFRGRCAFRQYIPSKPNKYGIKIYALVDASKTYTYNLEVYAGKQPEGPYCVSNKPIDVVKRLAEPLFGSGRNITADNWFTSCDLIDYLKIQKLSYVGTVRKNKRELPPQFVSVKERQQYGADVDVDHQLLCGSGSTRTLTSLTCTPLYISAAYDNLRCFRLLLQAGANPDYNSWSPVCEANLARSSPCCLLEAVLRHGCDKQFVQLLIDFGANLNVLRREPTCEEHARKKVNPEALQVFREAKLGRDQQRIAKRSQLSAEMERKMYNLSKQLDVEEVTNMLLDDRDLTLNEDLGEESEIDSHDEVEECVLDSETEQDGDSGEDEEVGSYYIGKELVLGELRRRSVKTIGIPSRLQVQLKRFRPEDDGEKSPSAPPDKRRRCTTCQTENSGTRRLSNYECLKCHKAICLTHAKMIMSVCKVASNSSEDDYADHIVE
ncbi:unnamed protein product [Ranitomeya imitator]|uniref:Uncharacterized protein n=1 Tax=Ranitomeya imitator TaxID=111125 RepID=A0ABN9M0N7_9NEOB|nr:unnamed protein product [Ranitomeya imitator]